MPVLTEREVPYEQLPITNNFMFCKVFGDKTLCKELLERMLHIEIDRLEEVRPESAQAADPASKTVRFDVFVKSSNRVFDIEMQMADTHNLPLRARYYQAMCDIDTLEAAADYGKLKESFVIFICPFDLFGERLPLYTFEYACKERPEVKLGDKTQKLFYNFSEYAKMEDKGARAVMEYFNSGKATDSFTGKIQNSLNQARGNESWRRENMMYRVFMQDAKQEGVAEGFARGRAEMQPIIDRLSSENDRKDAEIANYASELAEKDRLIAQLQARLAL